MKRNYITGVLITLALAAIGLWVATNTHWEEVEERTPLKGDAATNMFYSVQHLAESLGVHATVRHEIVTLPSPRAVMVISFWNWALIPERRQRIEKWVQDGGRLVVGSDIINDKTFDDWSGVKPLPWRTEPNYSHPPICPPRTRRLTDVAAGSEHFNICPNVGQGLGTTRPYSWKLRDRDGHAQVLRIPIGRGSVTVIDGMLFGNLDLLCGDGASLFTAATQLHAGDQIEFLSDGSGGSLLALIWKYGAPVVVLAALLIVLWLWRSGARFGPLAAAADPARRSLAEQIRGTGQFTLRFGGGRALYAATVRALNEAAAQRVPRYERLTGEERVAALASLTGVGSGELSAALDEPAAHRPKEIRKTIALLEAARRRITHAR